MDQEPKTTDEQDAEATSRRATQEELDDAEEKSKALPGMFANRIFVSPDGMHLRISFGERIGTESIFHSTIVVPNMDAIEFGRLIMRMAEAGYETQKAFFRQADDMDGE